MSFLEPLMSTGEREGNLNDDSDDDSQLPFQPQTQRSENLEGEEVECTSEKEGNSQLESGVKNCLVQEERTDVEEPMVTYW